MNKKKAMALLLVSVMAGSMLAGCGSDNASSSNDGSSRAQTAAIRTVIR